jgi:hypothetical protein
MQIDRVLGFCSCLYCIFCVGRLVLLLIQFRFMLTFIIRILQLLQCTKETDLSYFQSSMVVSFVTQSPAFVSTANADVDLR